MTDTKALRDLLAAATPGVWRAVNRSSDGSRLDTFLGADLYLASGGDLSAARGMFARVDDAEFVAAAHNALPALLDELDALRAYRDLVNTVVDGLPDEAQALFDIRFRRAYKAAHEAEGGE